MIRYAELSDLDVITELYDTGRAYMRSTGNLTQWINGYPAKELLEDDISKKQLYVSYDEKGIYAVFAFITGKDPTYQYIEGGKWKDDTSEYGTIHRIASDGQHKGVLKEVTDWAWKKVQNLRADTHADNKTMQHCLEKNGFEYCGVIYIDDGTPRVAYQKV